MKPERTPSQKKRHLLWRCFREEVYELLMIIFYLGMSWWLMGQMGHHHIREIVGNITFLCGSLMLAHLLYRIYLAVRVYITRRDLL